MTERIKIISSRIKVITTQSAGDRRKRKLKCLGLKGSAAALVVGLSGRVAFVAIVFLAVLLNELNEPPRRFRERVRTQRERKGEREREWEGEKKRKKRENACAARYVPMNQHNPSFLVEISLLLLCLPARTRRPPLCSSLSLSLSLSRLCPRVSFFHHSSKLAEHSPGLCLRLTFCISRPKFKTSLRPRLVGVPRGKLG